MARTSTDAVTLGTIHAPTPHGSPPCLWVGWWALLTLGIYPLQVLRMAVKCVRQGMGEGDADLQVTAS